MNELVRIEARQIAGMSVQTVSGRELHAFLGIAKDFSDWIKVQIERARLVKGRDFIVAVVSPLKGEKGGRPRSDYFFTLDAAKHISMMSNTDRGFEVRDYFLECERRATSAVALPDFTDPVVAARAWAAEVEAKRAVQQQLEAAAPKIEYADALLNADGTTLVRDVAKTIGVRVRALQKALKKKRVILPNNAPAAEYVEKGYFREATHAYETDTRGTQIGHTARVTGKGIEFLRRFAARHADLLGRSP